jgi:hypothetical protein
MNTIYKYKLNSPGCGETTICVTGYPTIIHFDFKDNDFYVWIELNEYDDILAESETLLLTIVGTGWDYKGEALKTCLVGEYVWHLVSKGGVS